MSQTVHQGPKTISQLSTVQPTLSRQFPQKSVKVFKNHNLLYNRCNMGAIPFLLSFFFDRLAPLLCFFYKIRHLRMHACLVQDKIWKKDTPECVH